MTRFRHPKKTLQICNFRTFLRTVPTATARCATRARSLHRVTTTNSNTSALYISFCVKSNPNKCKLLQVLMYKRFDDKNYHYRYFFTVMYTRSNFFACKLVYIARYNFLAIKAEERATLLQCLQHNIFTRRPIPENYKKSQYCKPEDSLKRTILLSFSVPSFSPNRHVINIQSFIMGRFFPIAFKCLYYYCNTLLCG